MNYQKANWIHMTLEKVYGSVSHLNGVTFSSVAANA